MIYSDEVVEVADIRYYRRRIVKGDLVKAKAKATAPPRAKPKTPVKPPAKPERKSE